MLSVRLSKQPSTRVAMLPRLRRRRRRRDRPGRDLDVLVGVHAREGEGVPERQRAPEQTTSIGCIVIESRGASVGRHAMSRVDAVALTRPASRQCRRRAQAAK